MTGDVLLDVSSQDVLDVLLLEPALHHQLAVAVNGAHGSQLGEKESQQVLGLTMQPEMFLSDVKQCTLTHIIT